MKPACWEACFLYPCPTVEHSNNCLLLLCRLFLKPSGHYTNLINPLVIKTFTYSQSITLAPNGGQEIRIPITVPDGYMFLCVTNVKSNGNVAYACYIASSSNVLTCFVGNDRNEQKIIPQGISADALFMKKWW